MLKYPINAVSNKIEGTVFVKILVDTTGFPICGVVIQGFDNECNAEALRLAMTTTYKPGISYGNKSKMSVAFGIKFKISNKTISSFYENPDCEKLYNEYSISNMVCDFTTKPPIVISNADSLRNKLIYPAEAIDHKTEGTVYVKVIIDSAGFPQCPIIIRGLPYGCNEEAIRNVMMIRCIPAIIKKKKAGMVIIIPVKFAIKDAH